MIHNSEVPNHGQRQWASKDVISDGGLGAVAGSAGWLVRGLPPGVSNSVEVAPAHVATEHLQLWKGVKVPIDIASEELWCPRKVDGLSNASLEDDRGSPRSSGILRSSAVAIDIEDRQQHAMFAHTVAEVDGPATVTYFGKSRSNGLVLEERVQA